MPNKKINKKNAVTFQLVHRSQQDPLIADDTAPQRVLLPLKGKDFAKEELRNVLSDNDGILSNTDSEEDTASDDEDRESKKVIKYKLKLPPLVFPSEVEDEVGMLGKAAPISGPQLHLDPDIVAAMDDDFNYTDPDNQLEDNFIELATGNLLPEGCDEDLNEELFSDSDDLDGRSNMSDDRFDKEETKSRFTNYSVTSSVIRRNDHLSLLDEKFEKMYVGYDENEIGALDLEEIEGDVSSNVLLDSALDEFVKAKSYIENGKKILNEKNLTLQEISEEEEEEEDEEKLVTVQGSKRKWDCESILSTYSNIYNHPKKIVEPMNEKIRINKKTGIPNNVFQRNGLTTNTLDKLNQQNNITLDSESKSIPDHTSQLSILSQRSKNETPEERKARKEKLREYRKERRLEKKINSEAFKDEHKRQVKIAINNRNNVQGNKIL